MRRDRGGRECAGVWRWGLVALLLACSGSTGDTENSGASDSGASTMAMTTSGKTETTTSATSAGPSGSETEGGTSTGTTAETTTGTSTATTADETTSAVTTGVTTSVDTTGLPSSSSTSTDPVTTSGASTGAATTDATTGSLDCGDADVDLIMNTFQVCDNPPQQVGQSASAPWVTCEQVCCVMGFEGCLFRAAQADYDACNPPNANQSGSCADMFQPAWSSQCRCI